MNRTVPRDRIAGWPALDTGLTAAEVAARRERHGPNAILEAPRRQWVGIALETARDPMLWLLAGTGALYALVGQRAEAVVLLLAMIPLIGMDMFLHGRTEMSIEGLRTRLAARARVVRDGVTADVPALDLVPGDVVLVAAGETFPADGLVVAGEELQADESSLTGEAYAVRKRPLPALPGGPEEIPVAGEHWGFAGTRLLAGRASLRVVFTGGETVYGEIVRSAVRGTRAATPLQRAVKRLVAALSVVAAALCAALAAIRLAQGHGWVDAVVSAVTLAAAALPEEFPVALTFFLGVGVYRLSRRQALVRRAAVVETIGRVSTICTDKTGTVTEGRLALAHRVPAPGISEAGLVALAALASRRETGDPMDAAILEAAACDPVPAAPGPPLATFPFTEARRRETAIAADGERRIAATKGAAETVLAMTSLDEASRTRWLDEVAALAAGGHKVIACAWRALPAGAPLDEEPESGFRLAGLLAFEDPVRPGVAEAVAACRRAGIRTIMVTGDHPATARAVAREVGLGGDAPVVISGDEVAARAAGDGRGLREIDVVARAAPDHKAVLVQALRGRGEIVAVTGDGVNDVPALRAADVGIAMGERGTRSARDAAPIVLLDDNLGTIARAVGEGRQLFRNLQHCFQYLLAVHIPLVLTATALPLAGYPLLYLPSHIVWLELIIHPTALLAFHERAGGRIPPGRPAARAFLSARAWALTVAIGAAVTLGVAAGYLRAANDGAGVEQGRAVALAVLTLASAAIAAGLGALRTPIARVLVPATAALSVALIQVPPLAHALHLSPLPAYDWFGPVAVAVVAGGLALLARRSSRPARRSSRPA